MGSQKAAAAYIGKGGSCTPVPVQEPPGFLVMAPLEAPVWMGSLRWLHAPQMDEARLMLGALH
jgi:hypothetical protein